MVEVRSSLSFYKEERRFRGDGSHYYYASFSIPDFTNVSVSFVIVQKGGDVSLYIVGNLHNTITMASVSIADADKTLRIGTRDDFYS